LNERAIDVNAQAADSKDTVLHQLLRAADAPVGLIAQLLACGADVTQQNTAGQSPLSMSVTAHPKVAAAMIDSMDPKHMSWKSPSGKTLLETAQVVLHEKPRSEQQPVFCGVHDV
jgi:hypothetical protein